MPKIRQRQQARQDLINQFVYLAENADIATAEKFMRNIEAEFILLARNPFIGSPLNLPKPLLAGMRKWHVKDFENVLIFYRPHDKGISIIRILHATQNWWDLLGLRKQFI